MPLLRSITRPRHTRLCAACEKLIAVDDEFVCLFGESVHRGCAFYRLGGHQGLDSSIDDVQHLGGTVTLEQARGYRASRS
jgi:hypothetical protein